MQFPLIADWSELPNDLLDHLTSFLSLPDYHRFSAVCRNWYAVAQQKRHRPQQLPWLVLGEDNATHKREFFSLSENKHYLINIPELRGQRLCGSSYGWLFTLDIGLNFRLLNPFTKKCYDLPVLPPYDKEYPDNHTCVKVFQSQGDFTYDEMQLILVSKAILDRDPSCNSDFKVLILYGQRKLACWRFGDLAWTLLEGVHTIFYDIIFFQENFYAVGVFNVYNEIYLVEVESGHPKLERVGPKVPVDDAFAYLIDYMGELLLVQRWHEILKDFFMITKKVIVRKIDLEQGKYYNYKPVDGHAVFMGANSCVTFDASEYPECKKNALYLTDIPRYFTEELGYKDLWIYGMVDGTFARYYDAERYIPCLASPIWLIPNPF